MFWAVPGVGSQRSTPVLNQSTNAYSRESTLTPESVDDWFEWHADIVLDHGEYSVYSLPSNPRIEIELRVSELNSEHLDILTMLLDQYTFYSNRREFSIVNGLSKKGVSSGTVISGEKQRGQELVTVFDNTDYRTKGIDELSFSASIRFRKLQ